MWQSVHLSLRDDPLIDQRAQSITIMSHDAEESNDDTLAPFPLLALPDDIIHQILTDLLLHDAPLYYHSQSSTDPESAQSSLVLLHLTPSPAPYDNPHILSTCKTLRHHGLSIYHNNAAHITIHTTTRSIPHLHHDKAHLTFLGHPLATFKYTTLTIAAPQLPATFTPPGPHSTSNTPNTHPIVAPLYRHFRRLHIQLHLHHGTFLPPMTLTTIPSPLYNTNNTFTISHAIQALLAPLIHMHWPGEDDDTTIRIEMLH